MNQVFKVKLRNGLVLGDGKIYVQSMLNAPSFSLVENIKQAKELEEAGCEILRVAVPTVNDVKLISALKNEVSIPIVADIHFDYKIAVAAVKAGVDKIRINPGNIGSKENIKKVVDSCQKAGVPIRIGINSGSLEKSVLNENFENISQAMVCSALKNIELLEQFGFKNIVISMKSTDVLQTISAYKNLRQKCKYPFHLGITEAGTVKISAIKSAMVLGPLLAENIGETVRVSVTGNPKLEIEIANNILKCLGLKKFGVEIVSCPTCGRTRLNIAEIVDQVEKRTAKVKANVKVAIMGCVVNGPGEAKQADLAIAGGDGCALLFKKGKVCGKIEESNVVEVLVSEIFKLNKLFLG